jgi:dCMP deaminase
MASDKIRNIIIQESKGYDPHSPTNVPKRTDYLSWDDYFLAVAYLSGKRSKDPMNSKGACIVDAQGRIVGIGYDGFPRGCSDDCLPWASTDVTRNDVDNSFGVDSDGDVDDVLPWLHTREPYLCHAEINAILNKCSNDVVGGRMFVPDFPCECVI